MTHTYDWSKLDEGWRFAPKSTSVRADALVHLTERGADRHFTIAELEYGGDPDGSHTSYWRMLWPFAQAQLAKCRIPEVSQDLLNWMQRKEGHNVGKAATECNGTVEKSKHTPDTVTVAELRPRDEYDWSRLDGSGWGANPAGFITNGDYRYWYGDAHNQLQVVGHFTRFDASNALVAQQEAERLVAKCKRDWRDEVMGAAPIPAEWGSGELHAFTDAIVVHPLPGKMKLTCNPDRRMELDGDADLVGCLRLSTVIERLKKLGWREA